MDGPDEQAHIGEYPVKALRILLCSVSLLLVSLTLCLPDMKIIPCVLWVWTFVRWQFDVGAEASK